MSEQERVAYIMNILLGIGKLDRERLTALLRNTQGTISTAEAAKILNVPSRQASKYLARWATKGWLSRIKRGLYISVPIESTTSDISLEDPWIIAEKLYHPCYIAGWSAAEYWGMTEQIFRTILVLTALKLKKRNLIVKGTNFLSHTISQQAMFGLKSIWRNQVKVFISDPTRTLIDLLIDPNLGGGIRSSADMLISYLRSEHKNLALLIDYAQRINNRVVFKRLGFLLEKYAPVELDTIETCKRLLSTGNSKLDPQLSADKLVTRWRLWIPKEWAQ